MADWLEQNQADGRWSVESRVQWRLQGGFDKTGIRAQAQHFHPHRPRPPWSFSPFYLALKRNVILSPSKQVGPGVILPPLNSQFFFEKKTVFALFFP